MIRNLTLGMVIALSGLVPMLGPLPAAGQDNAGPPPICARGAAYGPLPLTHLIRIEMESYTLTHGGRIDYDLLAPDDMTDTAALTRSYMLAAAIEWPGVLADRAAELPPEAHDLPWLVLLASIDSPGGTPVWSLIHGPESILSPYLLPLMDRHGLTEEARALRSAMALFPPDWSPNPDDRTRMVMSIQGDVLDETLRDGLDAAERAWPRGANRARDAAMALVSADPALLARFTARLDALGDRDRLDILMTDLWASCADDWWWSADMAPFFAKVGSAQAGLMMMDSLAFSTQPPSLYPWFEEGAPHLGPMLARLLDRRGLPDLATALRDGMAVFPQPFPPDADGVYAALQYLDAAAIARLDSLLPDNTHDLLSDEMIRLAREAGLLPG